jgi:hypothetical protein
MNVSIRHDLDGLKRKLTAMERSLIPAATSKALNKVRTSVRSEVVKAIAAETGVKQKDIRKKITMGRASKRQTWVRISARDARAKNLIHFVAAAKRTPGAFRVRKKNGEYKQPGVRARAWGATKTYKGTFIGVGRGGNTLVFKRSAGRGSKLEAVVGPSPRDNFIKPYARNTMVRTVRSRLPIELERAINQELRRFYARR